MTKIPQSTIDRMRDAIAPLDTPTARQAYLSGNFPRADRVKDLDKRYRWDLASAAMKLWTLYDIDGVNDTHIDTALRQIVPPLK